MRKDAASFRKPQTQMQRCRQFLGTYVEIKIIDPGKTTDAATAIDKAYAIISRMHDLMSFHLGTSDLSKVNQYAHHHPVKVNPLTFEVLTLAKDLFSFTYGSFDCAVAQHLQLQGLLPPAVGLKNSVNKTTDFYCYNLGHLHLGQQYDVSLTAPLLLDLGGIAKGYAVDQACKVLSACGVQAACVNAGGDLRIFGAQDTAIHLRHPLEPQRLIYAGQLRDGAFASSANYFTIQDQTTISTSALIEPRSGRPISVKKNFSVIASSCVIADGLTKALAVDQDLKAPYFKHYEAQAFIV